MIKIRPQQITDAKRFYEILSNHNFTYFNIQPQSIKDERDWLKENSKRRKNNFVCKSTLVYSLPGSTRLCYTIRVEEIYAKTKHTLYWFRSRGI